MHRDEAISLKMFNLKLENIGLKETEIDKIQSVFQCYISIDQAILYGSRAKGNFKPYSDIDITLIGAALTLTVQQKIENELDDLLLPYKFDLSIFHKIENAELIEHIERVGKVLYQSKSVTNN